MYRLALIILSTFVLMASPAQARNSGAQNWIVSQLSGDARVIRGGLQPASLKVNAQLAPGDVVVTGATGRATLARNADYIVVAPRSELRLPPVAQPNGFTRLIQNAGTLLFKVRHTGIPHFSVDTPMLAAVVKGTTFTVVVDKNRTAVQVIEGAVQVTAVDGGMMKLVRGGNTVFIDRIHPKVLMDVGDRRVTAPAAGADDTVAIIGSGEEPLQAIAAPTAGLVRAETTADVPLALAKPIATVAGPATPSPTTTAPSATPTTTTPPVTTPTVTPPAGTTPSVPTTPPVTTPIATVPSVTVPTVTVPSVTVPSVTVPTVTVPAVTTPAVTTPTVTTPSVTVPVVTAPPVPLPPVETPTVTVPTVTAPAVTVPPPPPVKLPGL